MHTTKDFIELLQVQIAAEQKLKGPASYYRIAGDLAVSETTVLRWKDGKGSMGNAIALKVATRLMLPEAYVIACVQAERERDPVVVRVWEAIAQQFGSDITRFVGKAASILLLAAIGAGGVQNARAATTSEFLAHSPAEGARAGMYIMLNKGSV